MFDVEKTSDLIQKSKDGDKDALDALIVENTPLVKSVVRRYSGKNVEYDDLMQLGSMGLLKAIKNFDENFNVRFSTYAVPMIAGEIKRFIRDDGAVKVSRAETSGVQYRKIQGRLFEVEQSRADHRRNFKRV